jgi:hypothetical protein
MSSYDCLSALINMTVPCVRSPAALPDLMPRMHNLSLKFTAAIFEPAPAPGS